MAKLIELKDAAEQLGITPEVLTEMVDQKKIFGYRDGASWKFKPTELERVKGEISADPSFLGGAAAKLSDMASDAKDAVTDAVENVGETLGLVSDDDDMIDVGELQLDDDKDDGADSILISEEELGRSDDGTSSTIIGKAGLDLDVADSDINIATEKEEVMPMPESGSDLSLADDDELTLATDNDDLGLAPDSDVKIATDDELSLAGDSDLKLETESTSASDVLSGDSDLLAVDDGGTGPALGSGIDLSLDDAGTGSAESSLALSAGSDALSLDDDDLKLESADSGIGADSGLDLDLDDDDLLAGSGLGSDITLGASDSGINLANPSDSGISLEDVGSGIDGGLDSSLELGDDDMIELEAEPADPEDATEMDAEFMLTPVAGDGDLDEESDDSGSQVIALDSDEFDESAATMLVADDGMGGGDDLMEAPGALAVGATATGVAAAGASAAAEEADFSVWNIVSLVMLAMFMALGSWVAMDVLRNIWSWNEPYGITNSVLNAITGM